MAVYFASDMHLRLDRPERGERLAQFVNGLDPADELYLVGDVCDFWFASRQRSRDHTDCAGLKALAGFHERGGRVTVLPGNHDQWLGPFYERVFGARFVHEPFRVEAHGLRILLVHGHLTGGRPPWKSAMESRAFLRAFTLLPGVLADRLDRRLEAKNDQTRLRDEHRITPIYRRFLKAVAGSADVVVFGHIHTPLDDRESVPRMVILGGWHSRASYFKVDDRGARLVVEHEPSPVAI